VQEPARGIDETEQIAEMEGRDQAAVTVAVRRAPAQGKALGKGQVDGPRRMSDQLRAEGVRKEDEIQ
jgi:hypothetical protein